MTEKADRVRELLANPYLQEAFENVRLNYMDMLENAPVNNSDDNVTLILDIKKQLKALEDVKNDLENTVRDGEVQDYRARDNAYLGDLHGKTN
ncbi:MAG: hypothetical protein AAGE92_06695 [Cyanobacteria bacterium P01_G01_bin.4]